MWATHFAQARSKPGSISDSPEGQGASQLLSLPELADIEAVWWKYHCKARERRSEPRDVLPALQSDILSVPAASFVKREQSAP